MECQPVIDGDVCFGNIEQERGTHLYHTKQGELLQGVTDTVLADLKAPGRAQRQLLMDVRLSKVLLRYF